MSAALAASKLSVEEYLALDRSSDARYEYHHGEIFPVEAASPAHADILTNLLFALKSSLRGSDCRPRSGMKVRISPQQFCFPDVAILCSKGEYLDSHEDTLLNPRVLIEILSPSTMDYDKGGKFDLYRLVPTFEEYVLISQAKPSVEIRRKRDAGFWTISYVEGLDGIARIETVQADLPLAELYDGVIVRAPQ